jgi:hypothetical protein
MRLGMRAGLVFVLVSAFLSLLAACGSEHVEKAATCSDPCCGGDPALLNCAESADVSCNADAACGSYGCTGGLFYSHPCDAGAGAD